MGRKLYDTAIIGAGPVGSRVAYRLAEMGHDVAVLDKKGDLGEPVCCTGIISRECIDEFKIDKTVIFRELYSASIYSPSGKLVHVERRGPQAYIIDRPALNVYLAGQAAKKGAEYFLNSLVSNIATESDRMVIGVEKDGSLKMNVEAKTVVIANGFGSGLAELAGFGKVDDFAMGVQAQVETNNIEEVEVLLGRDIAPDFFAWLAPTTPGNALAGLITRRRTGDYMRKFLDSLSRQGKIVTPEVELSYAGVALKPMSRTGTERLLVAGSAAGQVKPVTGGGVYYGLLCADMAADSLHRALENDNLTAKSLAGYDRRWKKSLGHEMKLGYWGRKFFEYLGDRRIDDIFDIIVQNGIDKILLDSDDVRFDWHSAVLLKLIGQKALTRTFSAFKIPFPGGKKQEVSG